VAQNPLLAKFNALRGQLTRGSQEDVDVDAPNTGAADDGGSSGSQGLSSSTIGPIPALNAPKVGPPATSQIPSGDQDPTPPEIKTDASSSLPPVQSESDGSFPSLAPQGPKNKFLSILSRVTGMTAAQPKPGQPYTGPLTPEAKLGALSRFLSHASDAYEQNFGTPLDRELAMRRMQLGNEAAWRAAMIGTKEQANEINQQKADTAQSKMMGDMRRYGYTLNNPNDPSSGFRSLTEPEILADPELGSKFRLQMSKMGLNDAQTDKVRDMLLGRFEVDPWVAAVAGDPTMSGQKVSAQQYQQIGKVLQAKGITIKDLGQDGMWALDRIGNKIHQVAAVGPSVARAQMYAMLRPVQSIDPEGNLSWMTAGNAIAQGAAPAGAGAKAISAEAQMNDIRVASRNMRTAIGQLETPLSADTIAKFTMAARATDDPSIFQNEVDTIIGTDRLTPDQQRFVTWMAQLQERAMSLRNIAGMGAASDKLRGAILATLPSMRSGNRDMMITQLDAFDNMVNNLEKGIPKIKGKTSSSGNTSGGAPKTATTEHVRQYAAAKGISVQQATREFTDAGYQINK